MKLRTLQKAISDSTFIIGTAMKYGAGGALVGLVVVGAVISDLLLFAFLENTDSFGISTGLV